IFRTIKHGRNDVTRGFRIGRLPSLPALGIPCGTVPARHSAVWGRILCTRQPPYRFLDMKGVLPYHNTLAPLLTLELSVSGSIRRGRIFYGVIDTPNHFSHESSVKLRGILGRFHCHFFHKVTEGNGGSEDLLGAECDCIVTAQQSGGPLFENAVHE